MNILIVHAHPEPQSFSSSLARSAAETLSQLGHTVTVSDLYAESFNPVSGRQNFTSIKDQSYFKQQQEELYATENNGFALDVEAEICKLEAADLVIFSFPLWWFGMPGILKGWVDRVFPMGRVYGGTKFYEGGLGSKRKARAMVLMTTGGSSAVYTGRGVHPSLNEILTPIHHGIFWFNGFHTLDPFVAWSAARVSDADRAAYLQQLKARLTGLFDEVPIQLPHLPDFPQFGPDTKKHFKVILSRKQAPDDAYRARIPEEKARMAEFRRTRFLLENVFSPSDAEVWRGFLTVRANSEAEAREQLATLPLAYNLNFEVHEIA